jgi:hypothetical protein
LEGDGYIKAQFFPTESPFPAFRFVTLLLPREPDALGQVFLFKLPTDGIVPGIGHIGQSAGHSKRKENGGVSAEGDAGVSLLDLV